MATSNGGPTRAPRRVRGEKVRLRWDRKQPAQRERAEDLNRRDEILRQLQAIHELIFPQDVNEDILPFGGDDVFIRRECPGLTLGEAIAEMEPLLVWVRGTLKAYPSRNRDLPALEMTAFRSMVITHILIGRFQDPNNRANTPYVYATLAKNDNVMWRTYAGLVRPDHCQVYVNENAGEIRDAAIKRMNSIEVSATRLQ